MRYRVGRPCETPVARVAALLAGLLLAETPTALAGQNDLSKGPAGEGRSRRSLAAPQVPGPPATRDFLFGRPRGWVAVRGTWLMLRAEGDLFTFVSDQLTVDKNDFSTPAIIGEAGFTVTSRLDLVASVEAARRTVASEYRRFVDNRGAPITQRTALTQTNLSGSVKFALLDPGRSVSRLAYVPRTIAPYVGAGAGMLYYQLTQRGDFVDFVTARVFTDSFRSSGWAPSAHVFAGTDVRIWRALFADVEGRYVWANGALGPDFVGFDGIDLEGFRLSTGVRIAF